MKRKTSHHRKGFTLIEVLVTGMLMAIVIPALLEGISIASSAAGDARHRTEAAGLAQAKMSEILVTPNMIDGQTSGDFSPDWPDYQWQANVQDWQDDPSNSGLLQQIDVTVTWNSKGKQNHVTLSTLYYPSSTSTTTTF